MLPFHSTHAALPTARSLASRWFFPEGRRRHRPGCGETRPALGRVVSLAAAVISLSALFGEPAMAQQAANKNRAAQQAAAQNAAKDPAANVPPLAQIERGREMFAREWKQGDPKTPGGDGLGPMFNARSCAECHSQGGMGGGGDAKHNVDLLSIIPPANKTKIDREKFAERIGGIHPAFTSVRSGTVLPSITLHKFGLNASYAEWRTELVGLATSLATSDPAAQEPDAKPDVKPTSTRGRRVTANSAALTAVAGKNGAASPAPTASSAKISFQLTQRSAPALFGAGLIDSIPADVLQHVAEDQAKRHNGIKGQVALASDGGVGKFGWRGQTATLQQFVMGACANELGLTVPGSNQAIDSLEPRTPHQPGLDLTQEQCNDLVAYVANLPRPVQKMPAGKKDAADVVAGEKVFVKVGCANCHVEKLGDVAGIYSDLLLRHGSAALRPGGDEPAHDGRRQPQRHRGVLRRLARRAGRCPDRDETAMADRAVVGRRQFGALSARRPSADAARRHLGAWRRSRKRPQKLSRPHGERARQNAGVSRQPGCAGGEAGRLRRTD